MYEYIHACTYACMNVELAGVLCGMIVYHLRPVDNGFKLECTL